jgi:hypothetical protein
MQVSPFQKDVDHKTKMATTNKAICETENKKNSETRIQIKSLLYITVTGWSDNKCTSGDQSKVMTIANADLI